ncbi:MAG: phenylalanine 4-monooxygenase [Cyclobacteriaceae bacterium]|nr:phenylalanine 4-monooxygenase [Cyclobacteriaceae bacterium]MCH8516006.1 phenylalanine 4-monooxygenase [Cyclobacteriaceae bacterium]
MTAKQDYSAYTKEDFQVWKILYDRQMEVLPGRATAAFFSGLKDVRFSPDKVPNFEETSEVLRQLTNWSLTVVPGIVDDLVFFKQMSNRLFPATTWLRKMEELDYLEEPDMFHDVFAHVPLLSIQPFVDFLEKLSGLALKYGSDPVAIHLLSRVYWYTIEFGLIREEGQLRIYGAGILSSAGESVYCLSDEPEHFEYDVSKIYDSSYRKDVFQSRYFIIESYEQLYNSLPEIESLLEEKVTLHRSAIEKELGIAI